MKLAPVLLLAALFLSCASPTRADSLMTNGSCHNVDMYGIYKICDPPTPQHEERREEPRRADIQPVYVTVPVSMMPQASAPNPFSTPAPAPSPAPEPPPVMTDDGLRRELTWVDDRLHRIHLLLNDKHAGGEITADYFDEEIRRLAEIERREQTAADANGGYLTTVQENSLMQKLQDIENEINQIPSNQG
jgi:hypothetical protein